jgi:hypothetical protein
MFCVFCHNLKKIKGEGPVLPGLLETSPRKLSESQPGMSAWSSSLKAR